MSEVAEIRPTCWSMAAGLGSRAVSAVLLLAGLSLCLAAVYGLTNALCITAGCRLYQGYSFLGFSLHAWGATAFGVGLVLLRCRVPFYRRFLQVCLWAEIILLACQVVYLPCSECLLVGFIWGMLALLEMRELISVKVWSVVFLAALVFLGKDLLQPWPVYGRADAPMQVYFSPSCKGCRGEIEKLLAGAEANREQVAFIPVSLKADDCKRVYSFQQVLQRTLDLDQAFQACWSKDVQMAAGWRDRLKVKLGMIRNRLILARMGVHKIPLVVSGSVASLSGAPAGECGFEEGKDCEDGLPESLPLERHEARKILGGNKQQNTVIAQAQAGDLGQAPQEVPEGSQEQEEEAAQPPAPEMERQEQAGHQEPREQAQDIQVYSRDIEPSAHPQLQQHKQADPFARPPQSEEDTENREDAEQGIPAQSED